MIILVITAARNSLINVPYSESTQNLYIPELNAKNGDVIVASLFLFLIAVQHPVLCAWGLMFSSCSSLLMVAKLGVTLLQKPQQS